ncbi:MAG TPA: helix-turn-helix domain-containing protein [Gemmatimonadaceae bacterium]|nr:helix-turn-helix domain-containing protein [Gemmatimonadaceae bacterium]
MPPAATQVVGSVPLAVVVLTSRDRARAVVKDAFPRRRTRIALARGIRDFERAFRTSLVDAAIVDLSGPAEDVMAAIDLAREFPSAPFFALSSLRANDAAVAARAAAYDFADVLVEGIDDPVMRELVTPRAFTTRFAAALADPPAALQLDTPLRLESWRVVVSQGGRPIQTNQVAGQLGVTREHLSRAFGAAGAPNLKRVIDLVRLAAAAELSKNPGYDIADVARVLGFASSSHLSTTSQRIVGIRPTSLARLRSVDLFERFAHGRMRSRPAARPRRGALN